VPTFFKNYKIENIVALDVEEVKAIGLCGVESNKAAIVSIVNMKNEVLLNEVIYHKPGSFVTNYHTLKINNIRKNDLKAGKPLDVVAKEIINLLRDKLVVVVGGEKDFRALGLRMSQFQTFELQNVYFRNVLKQNIDECACVDAQLCDCYVTEPMSLRDMYFYHFKQDAQRASHSALGDAQATMRVFTEGYVPLKLRSGEDPMSRSLRENRMFDSSINLKRMEKAGFLYCETVGDFVCGCKCLKCRN